ncbi:CAAX amino terminal protease self-immunity [Jannaschia seosinensis]|uniref:CAAX amino terminal protease self-immunity n=1 Tax=Jannaschia seosinensis TaxID=313367 RepID=A0A0M7B9N0_9RHOB|nr:CPBP family intramembrane glutamic endopeptidase [Jannaschia seosinensis]CUH36714.1 CAAX amino terminal protease self-immunity [Jannaschia seosinensis]
MLTPEFARFVAPARRRPQVWRLCAGLLLIVLCTVGTSMLFFAVVALLLGPGEIEVWMARFRNGASPTGTTMLLYTFAGMALGAVLAGLVHGRHPRTLVGAAQARPFLAGLGAVVLVNVAALVIPADFPLAPGIDAEIFLTFLPVALLGVLLQTGAEELTFRGYLQTQLAARFRSPLVWLVLPSFAFGALHYSEAIYGPNALLVVATVTVVGLIAADLTRVTGGIGAAWGLHFANNCVALLVVGAEGPLGGLAYFRAPLDPASPDLAPLIVLDLGLLVLAWAGLRVWFARRRASAA